MGIEKAVKVNEETTRPSCTLETLPKKAATLAHQFRLSFRASRFSPVELQDGAIWRAQRMKHQPPVATRLPRFRIVLTCLGRVVVLGCVVFPPSHWDQVVQAVPRRGQHHQLVFDWSTRHHVRDQRH